MDLPSGLDWDEGNLGKCQKHGVFVGEIEQMFAGKPQFSPDVVHSISEQRLIAVGLTDAGRAIFVSFTFRDRDGKRLVRPISARYMHAKEAAAYGYPKSSSDEN